MHKIIPATIWLFGIAVVNIAVALLGSIEAVTRQIPLKCPLWMLFGIPCPTCGLGRSLIAACRLNWFSSFVYHPLGIVLLISSGFLSFAYFINPQQTVAWIDTAERYVSRNPRVIISLVVAYAFFGILRHQI